MKINLFVVCTFCCNLFSYKGRKYVFLNKKFPKLHYKLCKFHQLGSVNNLIALCGD